MKNRILMLIMLLIVGASLSAATVSHAARIDHFGAVPDASPPGGWFLIYASISEWDFSSCSVVFDNVIIEDDIRPVYYSDIDVWRLVYMVQVPVDAEPGSHTLTLMCGGDEADYTVSVRRPVLSVAPTLVDVGDELQVTVSNLDGMHQFFILTIDDVPIIAFEPNQDTHTFSLTLPALTAGTHEVRLYVTVDPWMNLVAAVETGAPTWAWPIIRGYFPERLILVSKATFTVVDGVPTERQVETMLDERYSQVLTLVNRQLDAIASLTEAIEGRVDNLNNSLRALKETVSGNREAIGRLDEDYTSLAEEIAKLKNENAQLRKALGRANIIAIAALAIGTVGIIVGAIGILRHK